MAATNRKTLYVSDMDGTLLGAGSCLSEESRRLLNQALGQGANFTVATARTPATVSGLLRGVEMRLPAVVMTGAALWHPGTGAYSDIRNIPPQTVEKMMELYRRHGMPSFVYRLVDGIVEIYHYGSMSELECEFVNERIDNPFKRFEREACQTDGMPQCTDRVVLFYGMRPDSVAFPLYEDLLRLPVTPLCYHDIFGPDTAILEVFGPDTSKANAVRRLARRIGADRIVAFGDNINDLPLLAMADVAVAVANAVPQVREAADVVIGPNTSDSVPRFILDDMTN